MANDTVIKTGDAVFVPCYHFRNISFGSGRSPVPLIANCVLNVWFCVVAIVGNILVLNALRKASSLYLPSKMLLFSLVLSDLCVGVLVQPVYITFLMSKLLSLPETFCQSGIVLFLSSSASNSTSFLSVVALSLDRYAAFYLHANYKSTVTTKRMSVLLAVIWVCSAFWSTSILWSLRLYHSLAGIGLVICIPIVAVAYWRIYRGLRQREKERNAMTYQGRVRSVSDVTRSYRRTVSNSLWLYCLLLACYLPYLCSTVLAATTGLTSMKIQILEFTSTLVFINSSLNPFVYCWRIPEIRATAKDNLQLLQFWKSKHSREFSRSAGGEADERHTRYIQENLNLNLENVNVNVLSYKTVHNL